MMKKLLIFLSVIVGLVVVAAGVLIWLLQDPNRFKPELESVIADSTGMQVEIAGDLAWQLWPPIILSGADISFVDDETDYVLDSLGVKADLMALLSDGGKLKIESVLLSNLVMTDKQIGDITRIHWLQLTNFAPGVASPLTLSATLESDDAPPANFDMQAQLTYDADADTAILNNMTFNYDDIEGECDVQAAHLSRDPIRVDKKTKDDVIPLATFRSVDWVASCEIPEYQAEDTVVKNIAIDSKNTAGRSSNQVSVPGLYGGELELDAAINTRSKKPSWTITTDAEDLDSQQVAAALSPKLKWAAPLLVGGTFNMSGNTPQELVNSVAGKANIDAGTGTIDIRMLKEAVMGLAQLGGRGEDVASWPDVLNYTKFDGDWQVSGTNHVLDFVLDNIDLRGKGSLNPLTDALDMGLSITVNQHPTLDTLKVNDELYGVPIPVRCSGTLEEPDCGLDTAAAQATLRNIVAGKAQGKIDEKLDEVLQEKVPEEYRESAKELLDGLFNRGKKDE